MTRRPMRKHVVVLFIDLVGSTSLAEQLDPEPLHRLLDRYYAICTAAIKEHEGILEKFIGDAVMAIFGIPVAHEDDALRATHAAAAVRREVSELNKGLTYNRWPSIKVHSGIAAGEAVVVAHPGREVRVVGDVVNTAARLQSMADPDEIVLGDGAARAVRSAIRVEPLPPMPLKGKARPVPAWRVVDLVPPLTSQPSTMFVGRAEELQRLERALDRVRQQQHPCLVSVLGVPGIGKSRLANEFLAGVSRRDVTVLGGSCPSHGVGLTYRPLAELVDSLPHGWADVTAALAAEPAGERALRCLAAGTGRKETGGAPATDAGVEEIAWATRLLVKALARQSPLVVTLDDVQWAEPTLLDLITELAAWTTAAPVLLVCIARTELLEVRPTWGSGVECATSLELGPLSTEETTRMVAGLARTGGVAGQGMDASLQLDHAGEGIVATCGGNPLFATLMVELLQEVGSEIAVPPTIRPLLEARLDRLPERERLALQWAATVGTTFTVSQLGQVARAENGQSSDDLEQLMRQLMRRRMIHHGSGPYEYRFESALLRQTAYATTSKEQRAAWHLALAGWLSAAGPAGPAAEELAIHLESSYRLRREIYPTDPTVVALGLRAARALIAAGARAQHRRDLTAAVALLERGRDLLPADHRAQGVVAVRISDAWLARGSSARAADAVASVAQIHDPRVRRIFALQNAIVAVRSAQSHADVAPVMAELRQDPNDHLGWCRFHQLLAYRNLHDGRIGAAEAEFRSALDRALAMRNEYEEERVLGALCELAQWSPTPIPQCLALCEDLSERFSDDRVLRVPVAVTAARLCALSGRMGEARTRLESCHRDVTDLRLPLAGVTVSQVRGLIESLAGSHAAAADHYQAGAATLRELGQPVAAYTLDIYAGREMLRDGRPSDAGAALAAVNMDSLDPRGRSVALTLRAGLAADEANYEAVREAAEQAIDELVQTDDPCLAGDVYAELAKAYAVGPEPAEARPLAATAAERYLHKGAVLPAESVRTWLASSGVADV